MTAPITVWYWPTPNGHKVTIALEEMGLDYEVRPVNIGVGEQFTPEFLAISPNNRMPAIVDPEGADGESLSIFESGAILQHLGRKSGQFYPAAAKPRAEVEQWLFWQMGGLGPMCGQAHHFRNYAPTMVPDQRQLAYGANRYTNEVNRLYGVLNARLKDREFVAGDYSIADMAIWPWITPFKLQGQDLGDFPALERWYASVGARDAVQKGIKVGEDLRRNLATMTGAKAEQARSVLFGQRARKG